MKVDVFEAASSQDGVVSAPRLWRISTLDGVYWLYEDGPQTRLLRLPLPGDAPPGHDAASTGVALALEAETAAARHWVESHQETTLPSESAGE